MTTRRGPFIALLAAASFAAPDAASAAIRAVDKSGADNATCAVATPCETIGQAVSVVGPGDDIDSSYRATLIATGTDGTRVTARALRFRAVR